MVFSSIEFLWLFMPLVLGGYLLVPLRWRNGLLAGASLVFYVWGARSEVLLLLGSIAVNFLVGQRVEADRGGQRWLWAGIVANLTALFVFKYANFAFQQLDRVLHLSGGESSSDRLGIALPIGISFYTFHAISYLVDVHRGRSAASRSIVDYVQYIAFFAQLIAGPIVRYHEIEEQLRERRERSERLGDVAAGFPRFAAGLAKKVLIADQVAPIANAAFASSQSLNATEAWLGALAYTVQIYFDFSGYSDMAIGLARVFGFRFPENFDRPYSAVSMTDFWRRWHMSLSRFFRDYLYIPLGGSRGTVARTCVNLMVVFALTGLWHGAAWTFLLWGLYNGGLLVAERLTGVSKWADERAAAGRRAATFLLVVVGWVLFRSEDLGVAHHYLADMLTGGIGGLEGNVDLATRGQAVAALLIGTASVLLPRSVVLGRLVGDPQLRGGAVVLRWGVLLAMPYAAITIAAGTFSPFLYYQF